MLVHLYFLIVIFYEEKKHVSQRFFSKFHQTVALFVQMFLKVLWKDEFCPYYAWLNNLLNYILNQPLLKLKNKEC